MIQKKKVGMTSYVDYLLRPNGQQVLFYFSDFYLFFKIFLIDNFNNLMQQPPIFYAICIVLSLLHEGKGTFVFFSKEILITMPS